MDEVWLRFIVVAVVFATAGGIAAAGRVRRRTTRSFDSTHLAAGLYLYTSEGCATCDSARAKMIDSVGQEFTEFVWEASPERFETLAVDAVPSVLVVDETGAGRLYPGQPRRALRSLGHL